ncbi:MAG: hypothetical protein AAF614_44480 [Chloroflexota bacterium]
MSDNSKPKSTRATSFSAEIAQAMEKIEQFSKAQQLSRDNLQELNDFYATAPQENVKILKEAYTTYGRHQFPDQAYEWGNRDPLDFESAVDSIDSILESPSFTEIVDITSDVLQEVSFPISILWKLYQIVGEAQGAANKSVDDLFYW